MKECRKLMMMRCYNILSKPGGSPLPLTMLRALILDIFLQYICISVQITLILRQMYSFNPFQHDKILDQTKLKIFADDKLNVTKIIISVFVRVENIVGKGEIACISNFSVFHNVFKRLLSQIRQKVSLCELIQQSSPKQLCKLSDQTPTKSYVSE